MANYHISTTVPTSDAPAPTPICGRRVEGARLIAETSTCSAVYGATTSGCKRCREVLGNALFQIAASFSTDNLYRELQEREEVARVQADPDVAYAKTWVQRSLTEVQRLLATAT